MKKPKITAFKIDKEKDFFSVWDVDASIETTINESLVKDPKLIRSEVEKDVREDSNLVSIWWEDFLNDLQSAMNEITEWECCAINIGWRNKCGLFKFSANTPIKFLTAILPNTENTFTVYIKGKKIAINNFNHDSPTGEWFYLQEDSQKEII